MEQLTWVEINREHLFHNINVIESHTQSEIMYILKANAYGHGISEMASLLVEKGIQSIAIQSAYEISLIRNTGFSGRLLLLGPFLESDINEIIKYNVEVTIFDVDKLIYLENEAEKNNAKIKVHVKIETGLHRQGLNVEDIDNFCAVFLEQKNIIWDSVSTHFANIEEISDYEFSKKQFSILTKSQEKIEEIINKKINIHAGNSGALLMYPEFHGDMIRSGIINYGMLPSLSIKKYTEDNNISLKPVLSWKTRVVRIHTLKKGETLGYGRTYTATQAITVALLPIGYYDGYYRGMRNAKVSINGYKCPVIGTICMNMLMVDISCVNNVVMNQEVSLINETVSADVLAGYAGTINYEITTMINDRIPRIII